MSYYRVKASGELKNQGEIRKLNPNVSLPKVWTENTLEALGIDPVFVSPKPESSDPLKHFIIQGVVQSDDGSWVENYVEVDMFLDDVPHENPDPDAPPQILRTKAEKEAEYVERTTASRAENIRAERDRRLEVTDWYGLSDVEMPDDIRDYRQALRDVPGQDGFPHDIDWPTI